MLNTAPIMADLIFVLNSGISLITPCLIPVSVAVSTETAAGVAGAGVALKTKITVIAVPGSFALEKRHPVLMNTRVGTFDTVGVAMTPAAGAGRIA